jgi:hypothetical protein
MTMIYRDTRFRLRWASALCALVVSAVPLFAATHEVSVASPLVIPISDVLGGTDVANNAKHNSGGGYASVYDAIEQFSYPATHGNQLGRTAMVNDHTYWDSSPGGLDATHAPHPDPGGGSVLWWPVPGEWNSYAFTCDGSGSFTVLYRFSASWGPAQAAMIHLTIDGAASGSFPMKPDDPSLWADAKYQVAGWWGHTMVSGTCPTAWLLGPGQHLLTITIDKFPDHPDNHGGAWFHYLKVLAAPKGMPRIEPKHLAASIAAAKKAADCEQHGRLGQALTAYEQAAAIATPGSEQQEQCAAKATGLRAIGEQRLAAAQQLSPAAALPVLKQLADDFAGSAIGTDAAHAASAAPQVFKPAGTGDANMPIMGLEQATTGLKALVLSSIDAHGIAAQLSVFGKPQEVLVTGGSENALSVRFPGSPAVIDLPWEMISPSGLVSLAQPCIKGRGTIALLIGDYCIAVRLTSSADDLLRLAARLDPQLSGAVAQRLSSLPSSGAKP